MEVSPLVFVCAMQHHRQQRWQLDPCRCCVGHRPQTDRCVVLQTCPTNGIFWTRLRLLPLLTVPTVLLPLLLPLRLQHHPLLHPVLPPTPTLTRQDQLQDRQDHQVQPCVFCQSY